MICIPFSAYIVIIVRGDCVLPAEVRSSMVVVVVVVDNLLIDTLLQKNNSNT